MTDQASTAIGRREPGQEEAATLMELVPSIHWHDIATKRDLDDLAGRMELRFDHQDELWRSEVTRLETKIEATVAEAVNTMTFRLLPAMATMIAIFGSIAAIF